ncbi:MAG: hypothetical protein LBP64_04460 [Tannerella sp.]|jgi:hypothetical protein|nr:hypothetical protein [Tannerella sp.]
MKKSNTVILILSLLLAGHCVKAQFAVTPDGLMNANDLTADIVTVKYPGVPKEKLLEVYKNYARTYSAKKRGLSCFDNQSDGFMIKFTRVGRFGIHAVKAGSASYVLLFIIKDGSVEIRARDFKLHRISLFEGESRQYVYTKEGKLSSHGKILKPVIEREVNAHFNEIVDMAGSFIDLFHYEDAKEER